MHTIIKKIIKKQGQDVITSKILVNCIDDEGGFSDVEKRPYKKILKLIIDENYSRKLLEIGAWNAEAEMLVRTCAQRSLIQEEGVLYVFACLAYGLGWLSKAPNVSTGAERMTGEKTAHINANDASKSALETELPTRENERKNIEEVRKAAERNVKLELVAKIQQQDEAKRKKAEESAIQELIETGTGFGKMKLTGTFVIPAGTKKIGDTAFRGRRGLTSVIIPSGVTSIGEKAFYDCVKLTHVKIPNSVKNIKYRAFQGCESLETIDLPNGLTSIGEYAFHKCKKLITIHIPKNVKTIGNWAFSDCSNLMSVELHWGVKIGIWAFSNCRKLKTIFVPKGLKSYFVSLLKGVHFPAKVKIVEK